MQSLFLIFITFLSINFIKHCCATVFTFKMHHRFSDPVKKWSESVNNKLFANGFPDIGSVEYYSQLAEYDRVFRGRRLLPDQRLTFSDGNSSLQLTSLS
ncbi:hypothetical protein M8C21_022842 [Ambrosia artemisiifolia]|uniref:Uncharacterized protein n=1 Tax=Ambrosia artemisiifolia TaxID=4212 RepID=A0AAD5DEI1_AMBAR|nr:hypothetical protein M8C21_022842 [Ambrosia artemisiifolia]